MRPSNSRLISMLICGAVLFSFSVRFVFSQRNKGTVIDGKSFENILIGKSTMKDVKAIYGPNFELIEHGNYSFEISYKALGLTFYACQADPNKEIFDIAFEAPAKITTRKGIVLGKSTLGDVYRVYKGKGDKSYSDSDQAGIFFFLREDDNDDAYEPLIPEPNSAAERLHKAKIIKRIELVEESGSRQCDVKFSAQNN